MNLNDQLLGNKNNLSISIVPRRIVLLECREVVNSRTLSLLFYAQYFIAKLLGNIRYETRKTYVKEL